ncbi:hypothetical protein HYC85_007544 [Camellia sinensis]|uniref:Fucosyltransferase n=1 Tax=Camellia sinensis TaxID=4442 RepID=A0A7J7HRP7_CAMSI|nr:hypothetical protein HYC85_007544 [Camellia sinensis]
MGKTSSLVSFFQKLPDVFRRSSYRVKLKTAKLKTDRGSVPVVVGAPNIQDFAPSPSSFLHIRELEDANSVAKTMKYLAKNPDAYNQSVRWKFEGPSNSFKALIDLAAVHSSCRLCIYLATMNREKEKQGPGFQKRPYKCTRGLETVYHVYVRERGRFMMESILLR